MEQFCKRAVTCTLHQLPKSATLRGVIQHRKALYNFQRELCVEHPQQPIGSQMPHGLGEVSKEGAPLPPNVDLAAIENPELDRLKERTTY